MRYLVLFFVVMLTGCASPGELSEEENTALIKKIESQAEVLVAEVINPIVNMVDASIIFYEKTAKWPDKDISPGEKSEFETYNIVESREHYIVEFRLKSLDLNWQLKLIDNNLSKHGEKIFAASLIGIGNEGNTKINFDPFQVSKGVSSTSKEDKMKIARVMVTMGATTRIERPKPQSEFNPVIKSAMYVLEEVLICIALSADPEHC